MRGAALPGYAAFIFTYTEPGDGTFDELDLEIIADDRLDGRSIDHETSTDLRLNSWFRADAEAPPRPRRRGGRVGPQSGQGLGRPATSGVAEGSNLEIGRRQTTGPTAPASRQDQADYSRRSRTSVTE